MLDSLAHLCIKIFYGNEPFSLARLVFMTFKAYCNYHAYFGSYENIKVKLENAFSLSIGLCGVTNQSRQWSKTYDFYLMTSFIHLPKRPVLFSFIIFQFWAWILMPLYNYISEVMRPTHWLSLFIYLFCFLLKCQNVFLFSVNKCLTICGFFCLSCINIFYYTGIACIMQELHTNKGNGISFLTHEVYYMLLALQNACVQILPACEPHPNRFDAFMELLG